MDKQIKRIALLIFLGILLWSISVPTFAQVDSLKIVEQSKDSLQTASSVVTSTESTLKQLEAPSLSDVISGPKIVWTIIFLVLGYLIIRISIGLLNAYGKRNPKYNLLIKRILPIFRIFAWTFLIYLIIVGVFSPPAAT
ncbi:MAG: hypothetical protein JW729_08660, partial [Bacteroidales bacterium]|nr:hypothetical protein [Bacteroidales bacterium]